MQFTTCGIYLEETFFTIALFLGEIHGSIVCVQTESSYSSSCCPPTTFIPLFVGELLSVCSCRKRQCLPGQSWTMVHSFISSGTKIPKQSLKCEENPDSSIKWLWMSLNTIEILILLILCEKCVDFFSFRVNYLLLNRNWNILSSHFK